MKHSHTRIWIHIIWGTKDHVRCLFNETAIQLHKHLIKKANDIEIPFEELRIQPEHIHGLINLPANKCLSDFVQNVKGESTHWINQNNLIKGKFEWQRGYGAFSVSASQIDVVKKYIQNQEEHHKKKTFSEGSLLGKEEYNEWLEKYGIFND